MGRLHLGIPTSRFRAPTRHDGGSQRRTNGGAKSGGLGTVDIPMRHIRISRLKAATRGARTAEIGAG